MISIIVPIYLCKKYMDKMIQSILAQTYADFQVILVDDGSTDGSLELAREYEKKDNRIKVLEQSHAGVSAARNLALKEVVGEYILFIDGDDYIEPELLESLIDKCKMENPGCVTYMIRIQDDDGNILHESYPSQKEYKLNSGDDIINYYQTARGPKYGVCGNLLRTEIIRKNNLSFHEDLYLGEDTLFFMEYLMCCRSIQFIDYIGYDYIVHKKSLTTTPRDPWQGDIKQGVISYKSLHNFMFSNKKTDFYNFLAYKGWQLLNEINVIYQKTKNSEEMKKYRQSEEMKKLIYPVIFKYSTLQRKIMTLIFIISPRIFNSCLKSLH